MCVCFGRYRSPWIRNIGTVVSVIALLNYTLAQLKVDLECRVLCHFIKLLLSVGVSMIDMLFIDVFIDYYLIWKVMGLAVGGLSGG